MVSEVGLDFSWSCSLRDGDGTKPPANDGESVCKAVRINYGRLCRNGSPGRGPSWEILGASGRIDILRRRNDDLSKRMSCPREMKDAIKMKINPEETGRSGVSGAPNGIRRRRKYRVIGGPIWISTLGLAASPRGQEADPRQCWVPAEGVCYPKASDTPRHPCSTKRKYSEGSRQGQYCEESP
jgi:hypothetical protein